METKSNNTEKPKRGKPFPKGVVQNPDGAPPKTHWWSTLLEEKAQMISKKAEAEGKLQSKEMMAIALIEKAESGDIAALKEFADRVQGRSKESVDMNIKGSVSLVQAIQQADE